MPAETTITVTTTPNQVTSDQVLCSNCEQTLTLDEIDASDPGNPQCEECFDDSHFICASCDSVENLDEARTVHDDMICEDCFNNNVSICSNCHELLVEDTDETYYSEDCDCYCEECYYEAFTRCEECGCELHLEYACCSEDNETLCEDCFGEHSENRLIRDYNYKPDTDFFKHSSDNSSQNEHFGIELEVECDRSNNPNDIAESINNQDDLFYFKEDGSIDYGFEIITHPMTWRYYRSHAKITFNNLLNTLKKQDCTSFDTKTCGIHIHISRKAFTDTEHLYRFMKMVYGNLGYTQLISQRTKRSSTGGCQWHADKDSGQTRDDLIREKVSNRTWYGRYTACNLENYATVEVRIFRGTLHAPSFHKDMEYCKALVEFTKQNEETSLDLFLVWLKANRYKYHNLYKYTEKKDVYKDSYESFRKALAA